mmetsp:Transcript_23383/g.34641  ORF Transcript_23383/g.34641 Transcript_23383/m.34641 type:complete len:568 (+) Transcript_23383:59-1762(+)
MTSLAVWKAIASVQISTACVSLVASLVVAVSIGVGGGLTNTTAGAYKRIIFNISIADIIQSFSLIVGPFAPPAELRQAAWSVGNRTTCTIDGFLFNFGGCLFIMTIAFLSFYYMRKVKCRNMADADVVTLGLELKIYTFIVLTSLIHNLAGVYLKTINAAVSGLNCINGSALPTWCRRFPQLECLEPLSTHAANLNGFYMGLISVCFAVVVLCMGLILWHVTVRDKIFRAMTPDPTRLNNGERQTSSIDRNNAGDDESLQLRRGSSAVATSIEAVNRADALRALYLRETTVQAFLYTGSVFLCYGPYVVTNLLLIRGVNLSVHALEGIAFAIAFFYPLSGLFTILIYARPAVGHLRRNYPELSWIKSFFMVIKAGGEVPSLPAPIPNAAEPKKEIHSGGFGFRCILQESPYSSRLVAQGESENNISEIPPQEGSEAEWSRNLVSGLSNEEARVSYTIDTGETKKGGRSDFSSGFAQGGSKESISRNSIRYKSEKDWVHLEGNESPQIDLPFVCLSQVHILPQEGSEALSVSGLSNDGKISNDEFMSTTNGDGIASPLSQQKQHDHEA